MLIFKDTSKSQNSTKLLETKSDVGSSITTTEMTTSQRAPESTEPDVAQNQQEESGYDSDQVFLFHLKNLKKLRLFDNPTFNVIDEGFNLWWFRQYLNWPIA